MMVIPLGLIALLGSGGLGLQGAQAPDTAVYGAGDVQVRPELRSAPPSNYRTCLQDAGVRGTELVDFVVDTAGVVEHASVTVFRSSGPILDSLAVASVRSEVFRAGRRNGQAVRVQVEQPFRYGTDAPPIVKGDSGVFVASCIDRRPAPISWPLPDLPPGAVERGDTGTVTVAFRIDTAGHVVRKSVSVLSRPGEFDRTVKHLVENDQTWFHPGLLYGRPVVTLVHLSVRFSRGACPGGSEPREGPGPDPDALDAMVVRACR